MADPAHPVGDRLAAVAEPGAAVTAISSPIGVPRERPRGLHPEAARPVAETREFRRRAVSLPR